MKKLFVGIVAALLAVNLFGCGAEQDVSRSVPEESSKAERADVPSENAVYGTDALRRIQGWGDRTVTVYRGDTWFFYVYDPCSTDRYLCGMWNGWCLLCSYKQSDHISFDCSRVVWI